MIPLESIKLEVTSYKSHFLTFIASLFISH